MELLTVKEFARITKLKEQSVRNAIHDGRIKSVKVLGSVRIPSTELTRLTGIDFDKEDNEHECK